MKKKVRRRSLVLRRVALLLLLLSAPARGDSVGFKPRYDLAIALYQAGRFREAVPEFKAAYELDPKPALLFNIAQSYRKSGQPREAIEYYDRYLGADRAIDDGTRRKVDSYLLEARNMLAALELELKQRLAEEKAARDQEPAPAPLVVAPPAQAVAPPAPVIVAPPPPPPLYKRWWFWTALGGGVALVAGVSAGAAAGAQAQAAPLTVPADVPRASIRF